MRREYEIENVGKFSIDYNVLLGGYKAYLNGNMLQKVTKNSFRFQNGDNDDERVYISGNIFQGINVRILDQNNLFMEPMVWYSYILAFIPLIMVLVLGNMKVLVDNGFYFVGGVIGGLIGGLCSGISLCVNGFTDKKWLRVVIQLLCIVAAFLICFGIGNAIVAASKK